MHKLCKCVENFTSLTSRKYQIVHKVLKQDQKGFTLIEVMIVIAIIGILAAIAIPNFISYRDKAFCSGAESDANNIAAAIYDYYAIPTNLTFVGGTVPPGAPETGNISLTGLNTATISGTLNAIVITVTDMSSRCPNAAYQALNPDWSGAVPGVFTKAIQ